ncbi:hypothetical protein [Bacillus thuringiensis]|nr:hypothetical protein [Bacillus thuringiensis]
MINKQIEIDYLELIKWKNHQKNIGAKNLKKIRIFLEYVGA